MGVVVIPTGFGLFTNGGVAVAQNVLLDGSVETNALTHPARPNGFVTLWGTGLGSADQNQISVTVGGRPAVVTYAGHSPSSPGLDQINVQIPDDRAIPEGCYVVVNVNVAGNVGVSLPPVVQIGDSRPTGNGGSISFARADAQACRHPFNLTLSEMQTLDAGGAVPLMGIGIGSIIQPPLQAQIDWTSFTRFDFASVTEFPVDALVMALLSGPPLVAKDVLFGCSTRSVEATPVIVDPLGSFNLGDPLTLTGPNGASVVLPKVFFSFAPIVPPPPPVNSPDAVPDSFFTPGIWTLTSPGTNDVNPFTLPLAVRPAIRVTNTSALATIQSNRDVVVEWNPQGFSDAQIVSVSLADVSCTVPATAGSVTIPSTLLKGMQHSTLGQPVLQMSARPSPGGFDTFRIQRTDGTTVPVVLQQSSIEEIPVSIQ